MRDNPFSMLYRGLKALLPAAALWAVLVCVFCCMPGPSHVRSAAAGLSAEAILEAKLREAGASDVQEWIDGTLAPQDIGSAEWYILALSQYGDYDFTAYRAAAETHISREAVTGAAALKLGIALASSGSGSGFIAESIREAAGEQGIMNRIFGLHLLENGFLCPDVTRAELVDAILSLQFEDGGFALFGKNGDVDVTAMTVQALTPAYLSGEDPRVTEAVDRALLFLSGRQEPSGGYSGFGAENAESAAQVLTALSGLGIDCAADSRFIREGHTIT
ncbi:MAG: terpene cyclase/mutase family protein, partial [Lachnospiraceae bacterium]|nr:terpene cyclase/mutase family protein [Lachnospiraceae bacterium]